MRVATGAMTMTPDETSERNRRVVRILLTILAALVIGSFLVGVRW